MLKLEKRIQTAPPGEIPATLSFIRGNLNHVHLSRKPESKAHAVAVASAGHCHHRCGRVDFRDGLGAGGQHGATGGDGPIRLPLHSGGWLQHFGFPPPGGLLPVPAATKIRMEVGALKWFQKWKERKQLKLLPTPTRNGEQTQHKHQALRKGKSSQSLPSRLANYGGLGEPDSSKHFCAEITVFASLWSVILGKRGPASDCLTFSCYLARFLF